MLIYKIVKCIIINDVKIEFVLTSSLLNNFLACLGFAWNIDFTKFGISSK